jgi:tripartite-type tricarboxylate transporter receptor subunit TctC
MSLTADLPTISESGVPGFESGTWQGVLAPKGTPAPIVQSLNAELVRIIRSPEVRAKLVAQGAEVVTMAPPEFTTFFNSERTRWAQVVAEAKVRLD